MSQPATEQGHAEVVDPHATERAALFAEMWALEDAPRDDGLGDMLKADLLARIEHRLDVIGRAAPTDAGRS